eukprot:5468575-Pleurochrysis_carterae.AAC.1
MDEREQRQLDAERRFVQPSFCVYERPGEAHSTSSTSAEATSTGTRLTEREIRESSVRLGTAVELFEAAFPRSNDALNRWCAHNIHSIPSSFPPENYACGHGAEAETSASRKHICAPMMTCSYSPQTR